jgi:exodeoxyribonuclease VII small subunit
MAARRSQDYTAMMQELQALLADLQAEDLNVDMALKKYERGQELIVALEKYLETAENKITHRTLHKNPPAD